MIMPITEMNIRNIGLSDAFSREFQRFPNPGRVIEDGFLLPFEREVARDKQGDRPEVQGRDDDPNREKGHDEPEYKPELVCRTYAGDGGARPLAPGIVFWESPDIWVVAPDGSAIPVAGQVNQVKVHVWNLGLAPCYGVHVELFWCNPSVGVNLASATQIATTQTISLNAGEHRVLSFDWTPSFVNNGHECLVAQVYDPIADTMVAPFNPVQDRHVAQRNVNVLRVQAGMQIHLQFFAANLSQMVAHSDLHVEQVQGEPLREFAQVVGLPIFSPPATQRRRSQLWMCGKPSQLLTWPNILRPPCSANRSSLCRNASYDPCWAAHLSRCLRKRTIARSSRSSTSSKQQRWSCLPDRLPIRTACLTKPTFAPARSWRSRLRLHCQRMPSRASRTCIV